MPNYRREFITGGIYFFTVALQDRSKDWLIRHIKLFRQAYQETIESYPFETIAICILPDHFHLIMKLPDNESNFSRRIQLLKTNFSKRVPESCYGSFHESRNKRGELGIWQRRFWEHRIRNDQDLANHIEYIYYNPVKHGYVKSVKDWLYSSFHRDVKNGLFHADWGSDVSISTLNLYKE